MTVLRRLRLQELNAGIARCRRPAKIPPDRIGAWPVAAADHVERGRRQVMGVLELAVSTRPDCGAGCSREYRAAAFLLLRSHLARLSGLARRFQWTIAALEPPPGEAGPFRSRRGCARSRSTAPDLEQSVVERLGVGNDGAPTVWPGCRADRRRRSGPQIDSMPPASTVRTVPTCCR